MHVAGRYMIITRTSHAATFVHYNESECPQFIVTMPSNKLQEVVMWGPKS